MKNISKENYKKQKKRVFETNSAGMFCMISKMTRIMNHK